MQNPRSSSSKAQHAQSRRNLSNKARKDRGQGLQSNCILYQRAQLLALVANIVVNLGKPYEKNYAEMLDAWNYGGCCCSQPDNIGARGFFHYAFCCCLCSCSSSQDYHPAEEYRSMYCSELAMQILYDQYIISECADLEMGSGKLIPTVSMTTATTTTSTMETSPRVNLADVGDFDRSECWVRFYDYSEFETVVGTKPSTSPRKPKDHYYSASPDWTHRTLNIYYFLQASSLSMVPLSDLVATNHNRLAYMVNSAKPRVDVYNKGERVNTNEFEREGELQSFIHSPDNRVYARLGRTAVTPEFLAQEDLDVWLPYKMGHLVKHTSLYTMTLDEDDSDRNKYGL